MPGPRYLFCGSRKYRDPYVIRLLIAGLHTWGKIHKEPIVIIHGDAPGADTLADEATKEWANVSAEKYPADWNSYDRAAGPIRNQQMLDEGKPSIVFAFSDDFKNSKGTRDMVRRANANGLPVYLIRRYKG